MAYKFNAITGLLDLTGSGVSIPEYTSDPVSPANQSAWVLKQGGGTVTGGGKLNGILGMATYLVSPGTAGGGALTYQLSYRTLEGTTKRVTIS